MDENVGNCCNEPVEMIDWLRLSQRCHIACIVAASPNPKPCNDVIDKDLVKHSSRTLSHPSNTKPLIKKTENKYNTEATLCDALSSSHMTILPPLPLEVSIICLFQSSVADCAVGFYCLVLQSAAPQKVTHSAVVLWSVLHCRTASKVLLQPAAVLLILVHSLSVPTMGFAISDIVVLKLAWLVVLWRIKMGSTSPWGC
jgi:hypothetical protein